MNFGNLTLNNRGLTTILNLPIYKDKTFFKGIYLPGSWCVSTLFPWPLPHKAYLKWIESGKRNSFPLKKDSIWLLSPLLTLFFLKSCFHWSFFFLLIKQLVLSILYFIRATGHLDAGFRTQIYHFWRTQVSLLTWKKLSYLRERRKSWNFYFVLFIIYKFNIVCLNLCIRI